jgi:hypothetical protein
MRYATGVPDNQIANLTERANWPTPETAVLWRRFRDDMLSGALQKWTVGRGKRALALVVTTERPPEGIYRIEFDDPDGDAWLAAPDYRRVANFKTRAQGPRRGLFAARLNPSLTPAHHNSSFLVSH